MNLWDKLDLDFINEINRENEEKREKKRREKSQEFYMSSKYDNIKKEVTQIINDNKNDKKKNNIIILEGPQGCGKYSLLREILDQLNVETHNYFECQIEEVDEMEFETFLRTVQMTTIMSSRMDIYIIRNYDLIFSKAQLKILNKNVDTIMRTIFLLTNVKTLLNKNKGLITLRCPVLDKSELKQVLKCHGLNTDIDYEYNGNIRHFIENAKIRNVFGMDDFDDTETTVKKMAKNPNTMSVDLCSYSSNYLIFNNIHINYKNENKVGVSALMSDITDYIMYASECEAYIRTWKTFDDYGLSSSCVALGTIYPLVKLKSMNFKIKNKDQPVYDENEINVNENVKEIKDEVDSSTLQWNEKCYILKNILVSDDEKELERMYREFIKYDLLGNTRKLSEYAYNKALFKKIIKDFDEE